MTDRAILQPGDALIYRPLDLAGWIVAIKTWCRIAVHIEIYAGNGESLAARKAGVDEYPMRAEGLAYALRPARSFDFRAALRWFDSKARGQKYDWVGLLCFTLAVKQGAPDRMFCSEFATNFYRAGGFEPFAPDYPAVEIAPAQFLQSPVFDEVWVSNHK